MCEVYLTDMYFAYNCLWFRSVAVISFSEIILAQIICSFVLYLRFSDGIVFYFHNLLFFHFQLCLKIDVIIVKQTDVLSFLSTCNGYVGNKI